MAITILGEPTTPNLVNNNQVFTISSSNNTEPQFQYVCEIFEQDPSTSTPLTSSIQVVKQQPNPNGLAVFDLGSILSLQSGQMDIFGDIDSVKDNENSAKEYVIKFGEEYGTSVSSSVTLYPPDTTGSEYYYMLGGTLNPNEQRPYFSWNSSSKYQEEDPNDDVAFTHQFGLTDFPATQSINLGDYHTISILNGNLDGRVDNPLLAQDVAWVIYKQYDATGSLLSSDDLFVSNPRSFSGEFWPDVYDRQTPNSRLKHIPVGPQNLEEMVIGLDPDTAYYVVSIHPQATDTFANEDGVWGEYRFDITDKNCGYDGVRFMWKNQYGVYDYFTFGLAESTTSQVERQEYKESNVYYSTDGSGLGTYLLSNNRGRKQFYNKVSKQHSVESDYLTQEYADVLRELFFSTEVYVQSNSGGDPATTSRYLPVVITNASITEKTNPRSQKLFKYTAQFEYANGERPRI
jgi:hypothetical protein